MNKINYDELFCSIVEKLSKDGLGKKPTLLLHACCAPCSSAVLERVVPHFAVTLFFYNPNITDRLEYDKRLDELRRYADIRYGGKLPIIDGGFSAEDFFFAVKGLEREPERGARCTVCYYQRLNACAALSKDMGFDYFGTTLTVSPFKDADRLNETGGALADKYGTEYLFSDFKKKQGYVRSIELSKEYGLYRQNYCGCPFSVNTKEDA